jgi:hypothetical protein
MTPNKLPPLPELVRIGGLMSNAAYNLAQSADLPQHARDSLDSLRRQWDEALRQSQSLPAGAGSGSVKQNFPAPEWATDFELRALDVPISVGRTEREPGVHPKLTSYRTLLKFGGPENQGNTVAFVYGNSSNERESRAMAEKIVAAYNAITPGQALQADAREKGEAVVTDAMVEAGIKARDDFFNNPANYYDCPTCKGRGQVENDWCPKCGGPGEWSDITDEDGMREAIKAAIATQPAQASEPRKGWEAGKVYAASREVIVGTDQIATHPQPVTPAGGEVEAVGEVYTMQAVVPGCGVRYHATINRPLPDGTKLYTHPPLADAALVRDAERWRMLNRLKGFVGWESMPGYETQRNLTGYHSRDYGSLDAAMDAAIDAALNQRCAELPRGHSIEDAKHAILKKGRGNED